MLLYQIPSFLLDVIAGLFGGACLLRLYMQYHRVPFGNPLGRFVFAITDWIVLPMRRVLPSLRRWDLSSAVAAWLIVMVKYLLLSLLAGAGTQLVVLPLMSVFGLLLLAVQGLTALVIVYVVLSWVPSASSVLHDLVARLVMPLLRPLRNVIPLVGGVDLTPLVVVVLLQIAALVFGEGLSWAFMMGR